MRRLLDLYCGAGGAAMGYHRAGFDEIVGVDKAADIVASQMTEADHLEQVKAVALTCGWRVYHTFDSRRSAAGFPDLVLVRPPRVIFAELKRENGRLTIPQKLWGDDLEQCSGVDYYLWRPSDWDSILGMLQ